MKGIGTGRGIKALAVSLAVGLGMTACSRDYTVGYLYVSASRTALISAYAIDFQSGALEQLADSPIPASDNPNGNPVSLVALPAGSGSNNSGRSPQVYSVNHDVSQIQQFTVGTDGKLYAQAPVVNVVSGANGVTGSFPTSAAVDPGGNFLYVTFTYQSGFTTARPGPGGLAIFPIDPKSGALGSPLTNTSTGVSLPYIPLGNNPVSVAVSQVGNTVYVVDQEHTAANTPFGVLLAFTENTTTGALTPIVGPVLGGFSAGTAPAAVVVEPTGRFIYITDQATNTLIAYGNHQGVLQALSGSPFTTGLFPQGLTADPRGNFIYVANFGSSTVSTFVIDTGTGNLSGGGGIGTATGPTCVTIEPALGIYLYTSNKLDNSVSAEQLDSHTGALKGVQGTQFSSASLPTCAVTVANGAHATQLVN